MTKEGAEQGGLVGGNGGGIAFDGKFPGAEQIEPFHGVEDLFPLPKIQEGRRAAAEEAGVGFQVIRDQFQFADEGRDVAIHQFAGRCFRVKCAIRAFLGAERDVHVQGWHAKVG